jgi:uncharacterized protein YrrD
MYEKCPVTLKMNRSILKNGEFDEGICEGIVIRYNPEEECIYLLSENRELPEYSLDAVYECRIQTETQELACLGMIKERYSNKFGKIIKYKIQNGFYKKLVN